jgi:hypothetical protein
MLTLVVLMVLLALLLPTALLLVVSWPYHP